MVYSTNIMEEYMECLILTKDKINNIEEKFHELDFKTTYKNDDRVAFIRENIYFEFHQDYDDGRYFFRLITEEEEKNLYTDDFGTIDTKIAKVLNIIKKQDKE